MSESERVMKDARAREQQKKEERDALPPEGKVLFDRAHQSREDATDQITIANAAQIAINCMRELRVKEKEGTAFARQIDAMLLELDRRQREAASKLEESKAAAAKAFDDYREYKREVRLAKLTPENQDRGRELLRQLDEEVKAIPQPILPDQFGAAGGRVFGLEIQLVEAEKAGNADQVAAIKRALDEARPAMLEGERLMHGYKQKIEVIRSKYEEMLAELEPRGG